MGLNENLPPIEEKRKKKTEENRTYHIPKVKLVSLERKKTL
jgi:hypothetical protein